MGVRGLISAAPPALVPICLGGVQRGRSPFCRVLEGVPQTYHRKGGRVGTGR